MKIKKQAQGGFELIRLGFPQRSQHAILVRLRLLDECGDEFLALRRDAHQRDTSVRFVRDALDVALRLHAVEQARDSGLLCDGHLSELTDADGLAFRERRQHAPVRDFKAGGLHDRMEFARDELADLGKQSGRVVVDETANRW